MAGGKSRSKAGPRSGEAASPTGPSRGPLQDIASGTVPSAGFPVVGIGASAGGLAAFEAFFAGLPTDEDPGMAFVLVQHLAPDHESLLTELIRRCTRMPVFQVEDGMVVQPNCTYIIPPGRDMAFLNGTLQLLEPSAPRGQRLPVDFFFRSLAQQQRERAIGIVLSGTGSDGALGVRAIKGEGGMVMAQVPESTEFDGMPRSAIATGLVDFVLAPTDMAARLIAYAAHAFDAPPRRHVPSEQEGSALNKIFVLLRAHTGHDFSLYKPSTIHRRVARRMAVHQINAIDGYVKFLQQTPPEVDALFRDLLIGVTSFFRDHDVFALLERDVIPALIADTPADRPLRLWSAGCSTGEEAYSLAILLAERLDALQLGHSVQLFATDIDPAAIATARAGRYPASIANDVSAERLARYFVSDAETGGYRIHKRIRDLLIFSEQDIIKDPPFSKLDLISCRNVLIYMGTELQKKLIPVFHYALRPGGTLLLGTSEGIGDHDTYFVPVDRKAKVYRRTDDMVGVQRAARSGFPPLTTPRAPSAPRALNRANPPMKRPLRELTEQALLQHLVAAGALVNAEGDIVYLHGRSGLFLEPAPGEAGVNNILKMAREGLAPALAAALRMVVRSGETAHHAGLHVRTNGHFATVDLTVRPVANSDDGPPHVPLFLVMLQEAPSSGVAPTRAPSRAAARAPSRAAARAPATPLGSTPGTDSASSTDGAQSTDDAQSADGAQSDDALPIPEYAPSPPHSAPSPSDPQLDALASELRAKEEYLQSAYEELQSSTEELKSSNEEMQSVNEELQSANEELETAKEEMQSVNEELATVNAELQTKVADLSRANDDMNNLLAGTGIGTVFVDHQLRILRFTPAARTIINLIPSDVGRPVSHLVSNFVSYSGLVAAVQAVLDTLVPTELEVQTTDGTWYLMRILPYRTLKNVIEGAVISFLDVTETVRIRESLHEANSLRRLAVVVRDAHDAITVQDLSGRIVAWNPGAVRLYGWSEAEALALHANDRVPPPLRAEAATQLARGSRAGQLEIQHTQRLTKDGAYVDVSIISTALVNEAGEVYAIATTERALTGGD
jgi:two-component system CheB/CheR fusion protein